MRSDRRKVVITGMGCITSLGFNTLELWQNLLVGKSGISKITKFDPEGQRCQIAGEIKDFEPTNWIAKKEIRRLDLFTQYALASVQQAIEDAKLFPENEDPSRIGVILGSGMGGMTELDQQQTVIRERGPSRVSPFFIPKLMINAIAGEVSIRYGFQGPNYIVAAACASSAQAIAGATRAIQNGEADIVISGGSEAIITPLAIAGFAAARALSQRNDEPQAASRPFDKERDGFVMGEGSGMLVLEEKERALARNAPIYAELVGTYYNADAYHITKPDPETKSICAVMQKAMKDAEIKPEEVNYINAHGTSTIPNDRTETSAIKKVFGNHAEKIAISSTKSMLGHLIGASGAVEAIVAVQSIFTGKVHPTANYQVADPECDLDYIPEGAREMDINYVLSNSFGFGGHNVCLVFGKSATGSREQTI